MNINEMIESGKQVTYDDIPTNALVYDIMCTGNSGRSPLAEAIARDKTTELGLDDKILAISSGTNREVMEGKEPPLKLQYMVLERALDRNNHLGLYDANEAKNVQVLLADKDKTTSSYDEKGEVYKLLRAYESRARAAFTEEEGIFRRMVAEELELKTPIKKGGQQTIAHPGVRWARALAESNEKQVRSIYEETNYQPDIQNFGISNTFGLPYQEYRTMAYDLRDQVVSDIGKIAIEVLQ